MKNAFLKFSLLILFISFNFIAYALDLTDISESLADSFYDLVDDNEGTTSFRSLLIPMGGRAESLGCAYTGLSDDVSYIDYNPAASAILDETELSLYHNAWIADSAMESLAFTTRFNQLGLGAKLSCFYVPFSEYNGMGEKLSSSYYSETSIATNISWLFHPGYTFRGIAVGANLKAAWRAIPDYYDDETGELIENSGLKQSALAFMCDIGTLLQFNIAKFYNSRDTNVKIGFALQNAGVALTGFGDSVTTDDPLPFSISAGISYKPFRILTFTLDFKQPFNIYDFSEYQMFYTGSGVELIITDFFSILSGFQLKGANPRFNLGSEFEFAKMRFNLNYCLDLTSSMNPVNRISLSAKIKLGDKGRKEKKNKVDELYNEGLALYAEKEYEKAINCWNEALMIDKYFDPAKNAIQIATMYSQMLDNIESINIKE